MLKPILLVEDDPRDLELTLVALERSQLANEVIVVRDGEAALEYLMRTGEYAGSERAYAFRSALAADTSYRRLR